MSFSDADLTSWLPNLRRYARCLVFDGSLADDLVQSTVARALERRHTYREGNLRAWLFTVMHNVHTSNVRRASVRSEVPISDLDFVDEKDRPTAALVVRDLLRAVERLTPEQRRVVLAKIAGHADHEVAHIEAVPLGTVKSRMSRARGRLRSMVEW